MKKILSILRWILVGILGLFGLSLLTQDDRRKLEKVKENIKKAGEGFEKESIDSAADAANYIDDVLSRLGK